MKLPIASPNQIRQRENTTPKTQKGLFPGELSTKKQRANRDAAIAREAVRLISVDHCIMKLLRKETDG